MLHRSSLRIQLEIPPAGRHKRLSQQPQSALLAGGLLAPALPSSVFSVFSPDASPSHPADLATTAGQAHSQVFCSAKTLACAVADSRRTQANSQRDARGLDVTNTGKLDQCLPGPPGRCGCLCFLAVGGDKSFLAGRFGVPARRRRGLSAFLSSPHVRRRSSELRAARPWLASACAPAVRAAFAEVKDESNALSWGPESLRITDARGLIKPVSWCRAAPYSFLSAAGSPSPPSALAAGRRDLASTCSLANPLGKPRSEWSTCRVHSTRETQAAPPSASVLSVPPAASPPEASDSALFAAAAPLPSHAPPQSEPSPHAPGSPVAANRAQLFELLTYLEDAAARAAAAVTRAAAATRGEQTAQSREEPASADGDQAPGSSGQPPMSPQELLLGLAALAQLTLERGETAFLSDGRPAPTDGADSLASFQHRLNELRKRLVALERYAASAAAAATPPPLSQALPESQTAGNAGTGIVPPHAVGGPVNVYVEYVLFLIPMWEQRRERLTRVTACRDKGREEREASALHALRELRSLLRTLQEVQEAHKLRHLFVKYLGMMQQASATTPERATHGATTEATEARRRNNAGQTGQDHGTDILCRIRAFVEHGRRLLGNSDKGIATTEEAAQKPKKAREKLSRERGDSRRERTPASPGGSGGHAAERLGYHAVLQPSPPLCPSELRRIALDLLELGLRTPHVERELEQLRAFTRRNAPDPAFDSCGDFGEYDPGAEGSSAASPPRPADASDASDAWAHAERDLQFVLLRSYAREGRWREASKKLALLVQLFASTSARERAEKQYDEQETWERTLYAASALVVEACAEKEQYVAAAQALALLPSSMRQPPATLLLPSSSSSPSPTVAASLLPLEPSPLLPLSLSLGHALRRQLRERLHACPASPWTSVSARAAAAAASDLSLAASPLQFSATSCRSLLRNETFDALRQQSRGEKATHAQRTLLDRVLLSPSARQTVPLLDALRFVLLKLRGWIDAVKKDQAAAGGIARGASGDPGAVAQSRAHEDADSTSSEIDLDTQMRTKDANALLSSDAFVKRVEGEVGALEDFLATAELHLGSHPEPQIAQDKREAPDESASVPSEAPDERGEGHEAAGPLEAAVERLDLFLESQAAVRQRRKAVDVYQENGVHEQSPEWTLRMLRQASDIRELPRLVQALVQKTEDDPAVSDGESPDGMKRRRRHAVSPTHMQFATLEALRLFHERPTGNESQSGDQGSAKDVEEAGLESLDDLLHGLLPDYRLPLHARSRRSAPASQQQLGSEWSDDLQVTVGFVDTAISLASLGQFSRLHRFLFSLPRQPFDLSQLMMPPSSPVSVAANRPSSLASLSASSLVPALSPGLPLHLLPKLAAVLTLLSCYKANAGSPSQTGRFADAGRFLVFAVNIVRDTPELLSLSPELQTYLPASLSFFVAHVRHALQTAAAGSAPPLFDLERGKQTKALSSARESDITQETSPALAAALSAINEMERREPERARDEIEDAIQKGNRMAVFAKILELVVAVRGQTRRLMETLSCDGEGVGEAGRRGGGECTRPRARRDNDRVLARERRRIVTVYCQVLRALQSDGSYPLALAELLFAELRICDLKTQNRHLLRSPSSASVARGDSSSLQRSSGPPSFLSRAYVAALRGFSAFTSAADSLAAAPGERRRGSLAAEGGAEAAMEILELMEDTGVDLHAAAFAAALKATSKRASPSFFPAFFGRRRSSPLVDTLLLIHRMTRAHACLPDVRCFNYAVASAARQSYLPSSSHWLAPPAAFPRAGETAAQPAEASQFVAWASGANGRTADRGDATDAEDAAEAQDETALAQSGDDGAVAAEWLLREMMRTKDHAKPNAVTLTTALDAFKKAGMAPSPLLQSLIPEEPSLAASALSALSGGDDASPASFSSNSSSQADATQAGTSRSLASPSASLPARDATKAVRVIDTPLLNALLRCQAEWGDVETAEKLFLAHLRSLQMFHSGQNAFDQKSARLGRPDEDSFQALLFAANKAASPQKAEQFLRLQTLYQVPLRIQQWNELLKAYAARLREIAEGKTAPRRPPARIQGCSDLFRISSLAGLTDAPAQDAKQPGVAGETRGDDGGEPATEEEVRRLVDRLIEIYASLKASGPSPDVRTLSVLNRAFSAAAAAVRALGDADAPEDAEPRDLNARGEMSRDAEQQAPREQAAAPAPGSTLASLLSRIAQTSREVANDYASTLVSRREPAADLRPSSPSSFQSASGATSQGGLSSFRPWIFGEAMRSAHLAFDHRAVINIFLDSLLPVRTRLLRRDARGDSRSEAPTPGASKNRRGEVGGSGGLRVSAETPAPATSAAEELEGAEDREEGADLTKCAEEEASGSADDAEESEEREGEGEEDDARRRLPLPVSIGQVLIQGLEGVAAERLDILRFSEKKKRERKRVLEDLGVSGWEKSKKEQERDERIQRLTSLMKRGFAALRREWPRLAPDLEETLWGFEETLDSAEEGGAEEQRDGRAEGAGALYERHRGESQASEHLGAGGEGKETSRILLARLPRGLFNMPDGDDRKTYHRNQNAARATPEEQTCRADDDTQASSDSQESGSAEERAIAWKQKKVALAPGFAAKRSLLSELRRANSFQDALSAARRLWLLRQQHPGLSLGPGDEAVVFRSLVRQAGRPVEALCAFRLINGEDADNAAKPSPLSSPNGAPALASCTLSTSSPSSASFFSSANSTNSAHNGSLSSAPSSAAYHSPAGAPLPRGLLQEALRSALRQSRVGAGDLVAEVLPFLVEAPYSAHALLTPALALEALEVLGGPTLETARAADQREEAERRKRDSRAILAFVQKFKQALRVRQHGEAGKTEAAREIGREDLEEAAIKALGERGGWREAIALLLERLSASPPPPVWWEAAVLAAERGKQPEVAKALRRLTRFKYAVKRVAKPPPPTPESLIEKAKALLAEELEQEKERERELARIRREMGRELAFGVEGAPAKPSPSAKKQKRHRKCERESEDDAESAYPSDEDEGEEEDDELLEGGVRSPFGEEVARYSVVYKLENLLSVKEEEEDPQLLYGKKPKRNKAKPRSKRQEYEDDGSL
ncbi:hypothetical protein BESB_068930 [Besnoitia besnoiti]|uniref:Uncharacterized protein n=1 Tax=Besnoitia besnoiti TaxID=94643 RepID=A0A2A9MHG4_BESBE|nr:hypothetical protein BESB_068930 [Besnoitia besnoiti]PFH34860.1 hypothetical protein BESB_068930 [Besnoitia besnoiti]